MNQPKRPRGTGSLLRVVGSPYWYLKYQQGKKPIREATTLLHTSPKGKQINRTKAEELLAERIADVRKGLMPSSDLQKVTVSELAEDFLRDQRVNERKAIKDATDRWELHLKIAFGELKAVQVNSQRVSEYIDKRQEAGAAAATINREIAALRRMFNLGYQAEKVRFVPKFPRLKENNVRKGFVEDGQYQKLADEFSKTGLWMRAIFECGYVYGWRVSELLGLRVNQVDLIHRIIRLNPGETKNDDGRVVTMTDTIYQLIGQLVQGKAADDYVFTRPDGERVKDFRTAWENGCKAAGVPHLLRHDLRRTAVRNMVRAGVPEKVAMMISGHKTRSVFDRYAVFNERDIREAVGKMERHHVEKQANHFEEFPQHIPTQSLSTN